MFHKVGEDVKRLFNICIYYAERGNDWWTENPWPDQTLRVAFSSSFTETLGCSEIIPGLVYTVMYGEKA